MRKLLLLSAVFVLGLTAPADAREPSGPVVAAEFADNFPALLPMDAPAQDAPRATASGSLGPDGRVLLAATYWVLLGALALRRARRRVEVDWTPVPGWVLDSGPPLPR